MSLRSRIVTLTRVRALRLAGVGCVAIGLSLGAWAAPAPTEAAVTVTHRVPASAGFVVIGDTQQAEPLDWLVAGGARERALVRDKIASLRPDMTLLAGDVVGWGGYVPYWKQWRREYDGMTIYPVLGNHDLYGPNRIALREYYRTFPALNSRRWYEVRHGGVLFLMLDSNKDEMRRSEWRGQIDWLRERLDAADRDPRTRCVALVTHHPPYSTKGGGMRHVREELFGVARTHAKVRLFFSGHHHAYQHLRDEDRHFFVTGGAGAPLFGLGRSGLADGVRVVRSSRVHHLLHARETPEGILVEMHEMTPGGSWRVAESTVVSHR
jgi:3',5'-cyclic AMP phosphodiesterase CpdA